MTLPNAQQAVVDGDARFTRPWLKWFAELDRKLLQAGNSQSDVDAAIAAIARVLGSPDGTVDNIPAQLDLSAVRIIGLDGVSVEGSLQSGTVVIKGSGSGSAAMPAVMARIAMGVR